MLLFSFVAVVANEGKVPENFAHSDPKARDPYSAEQVFYMIFEFLCYSVHIKIV